jgi:hypothetical protein
MGVRVLFRCDHCDALPDHDTQRALEGQLQDRRLGEYLDAQPAGWLVWTGGGALGSKRYACPRHRDELQAYLRRHHAAHSGVWRSEPYPALWPHGFDTIDERELAALLGLAELFERDRPRARPGAA